MNKQMHNLKIAERATKLFNEGKSLNEIVEKMNSEGFRTRFGKPLNRNSLQGIVGYYEQWLPIAVKREKQIKKIHIHAGQSDSDPWMTRLTFALIFVGYAVAAIAGYFILFGGE
jgi:homospermidine synthase